MKISDLKPEIIPGPIGIESLTGYMNQDSFLLHINTDAKYADVSECDSDDTEEGPSVMLFIAADERTLRPTTRTGYSAEEQEGATILTLRGDWMVEASRGRHSIRVIGIRRPPRIPACRWYPDGTEVVE